MKRYYPVFLDLEGERALVVGSGPLASEKASGLRASGADVRELAASDFDEDCLQGVRLVVDCSGDEQLGARIFEACERARILVNVVDRPSWCRFIAPAIVDRHPLQIAISTGGESPYVASALRRLLAAQLGPEWGPLVALVGRVRRRLRAEGHSIEEQTHTYRRLMRSPIRKLLGLGRAEAAERLGAEISEQTGRPPPGSVTLVGAGPGDPALLTLAAVEALAEAEVVFHDALVAPRVLELAGAHAELVCVGKRAGRVSVRQEDINRRLVEAARAGRQVVRLKGGDPFIFGRGAEEVEALAAAGIGATVVPGVSAAIAAPAAAGIPLTARGRSSSVAIVTGSGAGGDGHDASQIAAVARAVDTLVVLMALNPIEQVVATLLPVLGPDRPAAVISRATLPDQQVVRGRLDEVATMARASELKAPATLIVGAVVELGPAGQTPACYQTGLSDAF